MLICAARSSRGGFHCLGVHCNYSNSNSNYNSYNYSTIINNNNNGNSANVLNYLPHCVRCKCGRNLRLFASLAVVVFAKPQSRISIAFIKIIILSPALTSPLMVAKVHPCAFFVCIYISTYVVAFLWPMPHQFHMHTFSMFGPSIHKH